MSLTGPARVKDIINIPSIQDSFPTTTLFRNKTILMPIQATKSISQKSVYRKPPAR